MGLEPVRARGEVGVAERAQAASPRASGAGRSRLDWHPSRVHDVVSAEVPEGIRTMLNVRWDANLDARRSISLLLVVVGSGVVAVGIAASPDSLAFGPTYGASMVPAFIGAGIGGYRRHRVSDPARAPLWGLASGASVAAMMGATLLTALLIHPTVRSTPGLVGAWSAVFVGGLLVGSVGALLWERNVHRHRLEALLFLAFVLIVGGAFLSFSTDPWPLIGAFVCLGGFGVSLVALESYRRSSRRDPAVPDTWR
jgi:hypothetical protein